MRWLAVLAALLIPIAVYFTTISEEHDRQIRQADDDIRDADTRIEQGQAALRKLPQFREETQRLAVELEKLRRILPPDLAVRELYEVVRSTAVTDDVALNLFVPGEVTKRNPLQEIAIESEVIGSARALAAFFRDISNKARIIDVSSVTLRKDSAGWRTDFIMTTHALPDAR
ncbi:MAG TPA: type 4a pilus biogenesis protein PilO [Thermoanaerobaculia bacterium]